MKSVLYIDAEHAVFMVALVRISIRIVRFLFERDSPRASEIEDMADSVA